jgi:hypothetical protein
MPDIQGKYRLFALRAHLEYLIEFTFPDPDVDDIPSADNTSSQHPS